MTRREEIYRRALFYIGNAESGLWGIKAREALDEARRLGDEGDQVVRVGGVRSPVRAHRDQAIEEEER